MSTIQFFPTFRAILLLLGELFPSETWQIKLLGGGVHSVAWGAVSEKQSLVVKAMPSGTPRLVTYSVEMAILKILHDAGCPVPQPIASSRGMKSVISNIVRFDWAITRIIDGKPIANRSLVREHAHQLGELLATLHRIPVNGHGQLSLTEIGFIGNQSSYHEGIQARWQDYQLWAVDDHVSIYSTIIPTTFPDLIPVLLSYEAQIQEALSSGDPVICHADLHNENVMLLDDDLSGVLDFGDAVALPPAWDFAFSARYFGWRAVDDMLDAYTDSSTYRDNIRHQAYLLGLVFGVFKLQRQFVREASVISRGRSLQYIKHILNRLDQL